MIVLVVEKVSPSLRGELTRWLLEVQAGVFVGKVSGLVRESLWQVVTKKLRMGSALLVYPATTEQGFALRMCGATSRAVEDFEGLTLMRFPIQERE